MSDKRKSSNLAFILSFFAAGLGMIYLKKWKKGLINFLVVVAIGLLINLKYGETPLWIPLFLGISSGAWAYLESEDIKRKNSQPEA